MARKVGAEKARKKTKRVRLGEALRAEMRPLMEGLGYRNVPHVIARHFLATKSDFWVRLRGEHLDVVDVQWSKYQHALFFINWHTSQLERMAGLLPGHSNETFRLAPWRLVIGHFHVGAQEFGWFSRIRPTVDLAVRRLGELESYLRTGQPTKHAGIEADGWFGAKIDPVPKRQQWHRLPGPSDYQRLHGYMRGEGFPTYDPRDRRA